jgi:hypothetical protein
MNLRKLFGMKQVYVIGQIGDKFSRSHSLLRDAVQDRNERSETTPLYYVREKGLIYDTLVPHTGWLESVEDAEFFIAHGHRQNWNPNNEKKPVADVIKEIKIDPHEDRGHFTFPPHRREIALRFELDASDNERAELRWLLDLSYLYGDIRETVTGRWLEGMILGRIAHMSEKEIADQDKSNMLPSFLKRRFKRPLGRLERSKADMDEFSMFLDVIRDDPELSKRANESILKHGRLTRSEYNQIVRITKEREPAQ